MIRSALSASLAFLLPAWRAAWGALALVSLLAMLVIAARAGLVRADWGPGSLLLAWGAGFMARGVLWRLALGKGRPGPAGLQIGAVEARLVLVNLLGLLFLFILGLLFFVVILAVAFAAASSGHGFVVSQIATWAPAVDARGEVLVSIVSLLGGAAILWAGLRISLAEAETVEGGKVKVLETWPLTRGLTGSILICGLVFLAPLILLFLAMAIDPRDPAVRWAVSVLGGLWFGGLCLPMSVGLMTYFHARRAPVPPS